MILLCDGDEIEQNNLIKEIEGNYFIKNKTWKTNFVGYFEYVDTLGDTHRFFSRPKNYHLKEEGKISSLEISHIIRSISRAHKNNGDILNNDSNCLNSILHLEEVYNYYKEYGIYKVEETSIAESTKGKINWKKTVRRSTPYKQDNGFIYMNLYRNNNQEMYDIISDSMLYILKFCIKKYDFYFDVPYIEQTYELDYHNLNMIIPKLEQIYHMTFKDNHRHLVKHIIAFLKEESKSNRDKTFLTTNYELVFEEMVHVHLNRRYLFEKKIFNINNKRSNNIQIDHFSKKLGFIVDSKYYKDNVDRVDYKQLFYQTHIESMIEYKGIKFTNVLVKPTRRLDVCGAVKTFEHSTRIGGSRLHIVDVKINIKELIDEYNGKEMSVNIVSLLNNRMS